MPKDMHQKAAEHHETAAKAHRTAAQQHGSSDHVNAKQPDLQRRFGQFSVSPAKPPWVVLER
jgi:hypothetical protein